MEYNAYKLRTLERDAPDGKSVILEYRDSGDYRIKGKMITAYVSTSGHHCANIDSFANSVHCEQITGHYYG